VSEKLRDEGTRERMRKSNLF